MAAARVARNKSHETCWVASCCSRQARQIQSLRLDQSCSTPDCCPLPLPFAAVLPSPPLPSTPHPSPFSATPPPPSLWPDPLRSPAPLRHRRSHPPSRSRHQPPRSSPSLPQTAHPTPSFSSASSAT